MKVFILTSKIEKIEHKFVLNSLFLNGEKITIPELFKNHDCKFFCDNLDYFWPYLLQFITDNDIDNSIVLDGSKCKNIKCTFDDGEIDFVQWRAKFGVDFDEKNMQKNVDLLEYAESKNHDKNSLGADSFAYWLRLTFGDDREAVARKIIRKRKFPLLDIDILNRAKYAVQGVQFCKPGKYFNVRDIDISGSYPASACNSMPIGKPFFFSTLDEVPCSYFFVVRLNFWNGIKCKSRFDWLDERRHTGTLVLTQHLFELFLKDYETTFKIAEICAFKTEKGLLDKFIDLTVIQGKQREKRAHIAKYNKNLGNSLIGYFGRNAHTIEMTAKFDPQGAKIEQHEKDIDPVYLPVYLAVLDASKAKFIKSITPIIDKIIYANTDGFLTTSNDVDLSLLNIRNSNALLGNFKTKHTYQRIYIQGINQYAGITTDGLIDNTISGMTLSDSITPEQLANRQFAYTINEYARGAIYEHIITL